MEIFAFAILVYKITRKIRTNYPLVIRAENSIHSAYYFLQYFVWTIYLSTLLILTLAEGVITS